jgi:hypothetical protein
MADKIDGDLLVLGTLSPAKLTAPPGCITDPAIPAGANVNSTKLMQRYEPVYTQPSGAAVITERRFLHVVRSSTAAVQQMQAAVKQAITGNSTVTVDLLKNGATILSAVLSIDNTLAAFANRAGAVISPNLVLGDVLEVNVTATVGTGVLPQGLIVMVQIDENTP